MTSGGGTGWFALSFLQCILLFYFYIPAAIGGWAGRAPPGRAGGHPGRGAAGRGPPPRPRHALLRLLHPSSHRCLHGAGVPDPGRVPPVQPGVVPAVCGSADPAPVLPVPAVLAGVAGPLRHRHRCLHPHTRHTRLCGHGRHFYYVKCRKICKT